MGKYINKDSKGNQIGVNFAQKKASLEADGANPIQPPTEWKEGLICVVNNGFMAAAGYAYSEGEMKEFLRPDGRPKQWYLYDHAKTVAA